MEVFHDLGIEDYLYVQETKLVKYTHIRGAYILPIYSPEHGDNPRYPNLEKIRRITDSACSYGGRSTGVFSTILEQI